MKNFLFIALFLSSFIMFSQGRLEKAKESLSNDTEESETKSTSRKISRNNEGNGFFVDVFAELGYYAFYGIVVGRSEYRNITPYPYYKNLRGEYLKTDFEQTKNSLFKISAYQLFNRGVNALGLNANYRLIPILGVEVSHLNFSENSIQGKEYLDVSSFLLKYYRVREQNISLWWGAGASYVANGVDTWGFAYTIGTEIFPAKPISIHLSYKQSFINFSNVNEFKVQLKYHIKKTALVTGYHANAIGSENVNGIVFGAEYTF
jgi:hypothetical protein